MYLEADIDFQSRLITEIMDSLKADAKENNKFVPGFALTKLLRLRQNVSNPLILEDFLFRTFTHTSLKDFKLRLAEIEAEIDVLPNVSRELSRADANTQGGDDQDLRAGESNMGDLFDVSIAFKKIICNKCDRLCKERQRLRLEVSKISPEPVKHLLIVHSVITSSARPVSSLVLYQRAKSYSRCGVRDVKVIVPSCSRMGKMTTKLPNIDRAIICKIRLTIIMMLMMTTMTTMTAMAAIGQTS
jgi:hypothetical protein